MKTDSLPHRRPALALAAQGSNHPFVPIRSTAQREIIRRQIEAAERPLSVQEIHDLARAELDTVSLSTVYRTLNLLLESDEIVEVPLPGASVRYEMAGLKHHHHFHCNECGRTFDLHGCPPDIKDLAPPEFEIVSHDLTLFGRCPDCKTSTNADA